MMKSGTNAKGTMIQPKDMMMRDMPKDMKADKKGKGKKKKQQKKPNPFMGM